MIITVKTYTPIAEGQTGLQVRNTLNEGLATLYALVQYDFDQTDGGNEGADNNLVIYHGKSTRKVIATLYDSNWIEQDIKGLLEVLNTDTVRLSWTDTLTETYHLLIEYRQ